jgi:predicted alpha/beta-hydrolase family hydrolase
LQQIAIDGIAGRAEPVSGLWEKPSGASAVLVLAHGAGAGMTHSFMGALAKALAGEGVATLRYNFPYMEDGSKRPDFPKLATATVAAAIKAAAALAPELPLYAGGKSFGGRMTTTAASLGLTAGAKGIVLVGFPLHPAKKPGIERAAHLADVEVPMLFLQGTRDELAELELITGVTTKLALATMHVVQGADHSFGVLKSSGRTNGEVLSELAQVTAAFMK